jgi:hypothetical protein
VPRGYNSRQRNESWEGAIMSEIPIRFPPTATAEDKERLERDFATYRRELPRLLKEGHAGRYAIIRGGEVVSIWDTQADALQAACERFGLKSVAINQINPIDMERFGLLKALTSQS